MKDLLPRGQHLVLTIAGSFRVSLFIDLGVHRTWEHGRGELLSFMIEWNLKFGRGHSIIFQYSVHGTQGAQYMVHRVPSTELTKLVSVRILSL